MKYLNLGLLALSSLFAGACAAPASTGLESLPIKTPDVPAAPGVPVNELPGSGDLTKVDKRTTVVLTKVQYTIVEVKKHCGAINSTVDNTGGQVQNKADVIKLVKSEVTLIIGLVNTLVGEVCGLLGDATQIVGEEKDQIISSVLELIFEILCTLQHVIKVLGITIFELLGPLVFVLLSVVFNLLTTLNTVVDGLLQCVFTVLGGVINLLLSVLGGLLPIVFGIAGGVLNKLNLSGLLCSLF